MSQYQLFKTYSCESGNRVSVSPNQYYTMTSITFNISDIGMRCWEHPSEGWATECDGDRITSEFKTAIEAHPEFDGWKPRCATGCGADDEHCDCDDETKKKVLLARLRSTFAAATITEFTWGFRVAQTGDHLTMSTDFRVDEEEDEPDTVCEVCEETVPYSDYAGCCNDGACSHSIERMCTDCGTWDNEEEVWRCPDCVPGDE